MMTKLTPAQLIAHFGLMKLPEEGGFFREIYKAREGIPGNLICTDGRPRVYVSDIYYLLTASEFNGFHRIKHSVEIISFYSGAPTETIQIDPSGNLSRSVMGSEFGSGQVPKVVVPVGNWLGMRLAEGGDWALFGVTCVPGFEYEDFEGGSYTILTELFPAHSDVIRRFTHF